VTTLASAGTAQSSIDLGIDMGSRLLLGPEKRVTAPPEQKSMGGNSWSRELSTETQMRKIKTTVLVATQQEERQRFTRETSDLLKEQRENLTAPMRSKNEIFN
jgi:hypothetical protein